MLKTNICLINTPNPELRDDRLDVPIGLLYIATHLKNRGHSVSICDLAGIPESEWVNIIPFANYYGFSTYTCNFHITLRIKDIAKQINPKAITIVGGAHATALPEETSKLGFDYVVIGEGEGAIESIIEDKESVFVRMPPILNLDNLPYIDYSLVDINSYHRLIESEKAISVFSSRGCPFNCSFCSSKAVDYGRQYRKRSVGHFLGELEQIKKDYGDIRFRIKDDLFTYDVGWIKEFARNADNLKYDCLVRAGYHQDIPKYLKDSGCTIVSIGIESGSDRVLKVMNKHTTREVNIQAIRQMKDAGIKVLIWIIVGFPGEDWNSVKETVDMVNETAPDITTIYPLIPYPGTDIWKNPKRYGMRIIDRDFSHYYYIKGNYESGYVYETDTLTPEIIRDMKQYMKDNITESDIR